MWIFGYGSLIWKVDFPFIRKEYGYIEGYVRRFWQASVDHRGTPEKPGRVVTLVRSQDANERVWGVAYELCDHLSAGILNQLDIREKCGYERRTVTFHPRPCLHSDLADDEPLSSPAPHQLTIYVALADNPYFTGPVSEDELAEVMVGACGQAGSNTEYLYKLVDAVRSCFPHVHEPHLSALEEAVRRRELQLIR